MVCEMISSPSQVLMKIIFLTYLVISWRSYLILHGETNDVNEVIKCLIVFLDRKSHGLGKKSSRPIYLKY